MERLDRRIAGVLAGDEEAQLRLRDPVAVLGAVRCKHKVGLRTTPFGQALRSGRLGPEWIEYDTDIVTIGGYVDPLADEFCLGVMYAASGLAINCDAQWKVVEDGRGRACSSPAVSAGRQGRACAAAAVASSCRTRPCSRTTAVPPSFRGCVVSYRLLIAFARR